MDTTNFYLFSFIAALAIYILFAFLSRRNERKKSLLLQTGFDLLGKNEKFLTYHKFTKLKDFDYLNPDGRTRSKYTTYSKFNKGFFIEVIFKEGGVTSVTFKNRGASNESFLSFKNKNISKALTLGATKNAFGFYTIDNTTLSFHDGFFMVNISN